MQEAVDNLVKNALDHTKSGDTIQVEWNALPSMVQIKVRDNGSGIHPEDLYHIFKRFIAAAFHKIHRASGWVCRWQKPLWKPITAPLK